MRSFFNSVFTVWWLLFECHLNVITTIYISWLHLKLKLRAAKKSMVTIVHQLLTHCYVNTQASVDDKEAETTLRSCYMSNIIYVLWCPGMYIILLRIYNYSNINVVYHSNKIIIIISTITITTEHPMELWYFLVTCRSDKLNEKLWEEFLSVVTVLITEKRLVLIFRDIDDLYTTVS